MAEGISFQHIIKECCAPKQQKVAAAAVDNDFKIVPLDNDNAAVLSLQSSYNSVSLVPIK